nr:hypothetical protein Itr_chr05CG19100 [Ipomoea trifida]
MLSIMVLDFIVDMANASMLPTLLITFSKFPSARGAIAQSCPTSCDGIASFVTGFGRIKIKMLSIRIFNPHTFMFLTPLSSG